MRKLAELNRELGGKLSDIAAAHLLERGLLTAGWVYTHVVAVVLMWSVHINTRAVVLQGSARSRERAQSFGGETAVTRPDHGPQGE